MREIKDLITKSLYSSRNTGELNFSRFSDISSLERMGLEFGIEHLKKILANKELTQIAISPIIHIPNWINDFINYLTENVRSKKYNYKSRKILKYKTAIEVLALN
jgi:hypothetical protein